MQELESILKLQVIHVGVFIVSLVQLGRSNVIRHPSGPLLGSFVGKKWDSRCKGESASSCE